jgi:hypothetical protein
LTSKSNVSVRDEGDAAAQSGAAWAAAPGTPASPTSALPKATPTTAATGFRGHTDVTDSQQTDIHVTGGPNSRDPILIAPTQMASVETHGLALGTSDHAAATGKGTQASSGAANAQGLVAQNQVSTNATASVHVGGENFAPITILIDAITQISNVGVASSTSGAATANANANATPSSVSRAPASSSGNAHAIGSQVVNRTTLRSAASVHVAGDNYNPINLILNLAAQFVNWGVGVANSGDAAGTSGSASAIGLQVTNLVNMWASASVDIDGNNYAPIVIEVHFNTTIDNAGVALARTGAASAGGSISGIPTGSSGTSSTASSGQPVRAAGGNAAAIASSADVAVQSNQSANANGAKLPISAAMTRALQDLPTGNWTSAMERSLADAASPTPLPGVSSTSGDSIAQGLHSTISQTNTQLAGCMYPGVACLARNVGSLASTAADLPGGTSAAAGGALVNVTPTPAPATSTAARPDPTNQTSTTTVTTSTSSSAIATRQQGSPVNSGGSQHSDKYHVAAELSPSGYVAVVDPWDSWPSRWLPPMPAPLGARPFSSSVATSFNGLTSPVELPLQDLQRSDVNPSLPGAVGELVGETRSINQPVPLMSILDVEAVDTWPDLQSMPMPEQAMRPVPPVLPSAPEDPGATTVEFGPATLLPLLFGGLGGSRQGRQLLLRFSRKTVPFVACVVALLLFMGRV